MADKKVIQTRKRIVKPHATIANISYHLDKHAREYPRGSQLFRMAGLVMEAFFIEGYATVVAQNLPNTYDLLAIPGTKERVKAIFKAADSGADFGKRPYQSVTQLLSFRDNMAHPKEENLREEKIISVGELTDDIDSIPWNLRTETEQFCTPENSLQVRQDIAEIMSRTWNCDWDSHALDPGMETVDRKVE
ncbi:hypothetical protein [Marinobacter sp. S0848L]|uniref:hypothetical protein n=1 Tax=Marinobacter sp. S0848L TaxID=2926423 RepID=UPI001FF159AF|nr:hypothetical protein [Marinobacter sp. S0848L]MCK0106875.1 hypothetical protein [Marinobacter sp. S0848L]